MQSKYRQSEQVEYHIKKIRRNKSHELIQKAKEINNKHFSYKLKGRKSSVNL